MSIRALNHVRNIRAGDFEQAILLYLAFCQNETTGQCNPTRENIREFFDSEDHPVSLKRVDRALAGLRKKGFIASKKVVCDKGVQNWYFFPMMGESTPEQGVAPTMGVTPTVNPSPHDGQGVAPTMGVTPTVNPSPHDGQGVAPTVGLTGSPHGGGCKRKEKRKEKESSKTSFSIPRPGDVPEQLWADFVTHRKAKKAPITETVIKRTRSEAAKCSMTLSQAIEMMVARGWQGFEARYVLDNRPKNQFMVGYREPDKPIPPAQNPFLVNRPKPSKTRHELEREDEMRDAEELFGGLL